MNGTPTKELVFEDLSPEDRQLFRDAYGKLPPERQAQLVGGHALEGAMATQGGMELTNQPDATEGTTSNDTDALREAPDAEQHATANQSAPAAKRYSNKRRSNEQTGRNEESTRTEPARGSNGMRDSTGQYLHEIGQVSLLNAAEEKELAQKIELSRESQAILDDPESKLSREQKRQHERIIREAQKARELFIRANLRLVVSRARRYPIPPGMELLDLIQEGNIGLEHAVEKFDGDKGFKFSTYAVWWIQHDISRALDQKGNLVRLPAEKSGQLRRAMREVSGDIEEELDEEMRELHCLASPTSLNRPLSGEEDELHDLLPDTTLPGPEAAAIDAIEDAVKSKMIEKLMGQLTQDERRAVEYRIGLTDGDEHSYREVGERLGKSSYAAGKLVKNAMEKLTKIALEQGIDSDLLDD
jgi:RNA polymerase primary sigma factor